MKKIPKSIKPIVKFFTSLKLTVVLLTFSLLLTFFGTLAQVQDGLYEVQKEYFQSFFVIHEQPISQKEDGNLVSVHFPLPGGYLIGTMLLINLIAGFIARFKFTVSKCGIYISHLGLILLLLGQLATEAYQEESNIRFEEGEKRNYSQSYREFELAFTQPGSSSSKEKVTVIPEKFLYKSKSKNKSISSSLLPFEIKISNLFTNSTINQLAADKLRDDFQGAGKRFEAIGKSKVATMDEVNIPACELELIDKSDQKSIAKFLVTPELFPQSFKIGETPYKIHLRFERFYKPFHLHLVDFRHDKFTGTQTPRNFSSLVQLENNDSKENRPVNIKMNSPLRYGNETYYQASFDKVNPRITVLQCVSNPSSLLPYISCSLMSLGLTIQFLFHLTKFVGKQMKATKKS